MFGYLEWSGEKQGRRGVSAREQVLNGVRFYMVTVYRGEHSRAAVLRRRCAVGAKLMKKAGVGRAVLPAEFPFPETLARQDIRPVSDMGLRRELAAELASFAMAERGVQPGGATVAVTAERLSPEVIRAVTALCRRSRYVLLDVPYGGEGLCRELRRSHGVSLLLSPTQEQLEGADVLVQFGRKEHLCHRGRVTLPLYSGAEKAFSWSAALAGERGEMLPTPLLTALWETGAVRPECLEVRSLCFFMGERGN